jgi:putative N6-adenine-specific DNA methylase
MNPHLSAVDCRMEFYCLPGISSWVSMGDMNMKFFVTSAKGLEELVAAELSALGLSELKIERGGVSFNGRLEDSYKACLWLRTASRVLLVLAEFPCASPEELYAGVRTVEWPLYLKPDMTMAVDSVLRDSAMTHSGFLALKTKDAIVDAIRDKFGRRPDVDTKSPDLQVNVHLVKNRCTVTLDMAGEPLDRRGYRLDRNKAPLRENMAAALVAFSGWTGDTPLYDPMCGSGTIVIEAALKAANTAPGLLRERFGFQNWPDHDPTLWRRMLHEAKDLRQHELAVRLSGSDRSPGSIEMSRQNAARAGVGKLASFTTADISTFEPSASPAMIIFNPPYGDRLGELDELASLYRTFGDVLKKRCAGSTAYILCGNSELVRHIGLKATRRIPVWNGPIECRLLKYELY